MRLIVSVHYSDGRPPDCSARFILFDPEQDHDEFVQMWEEDGCANVHLISGNSVCWVIGKEERVDDLNGGRFVHLMVQEEPEGGWSP